MKDLVMTAFDWTIDTLMIGLSLCDIGVTLGRSFSSQRSYQLFNPSESIARRWLICVPLGINLPWDIQDPVSIVGLRLSTRHEGQCTPNGISQSDERYDCTITPWLRLRP
jgi:hypothetical protein